MAEKAEFVTPDPKLMELLNKVVEQNGKILDCNVELFNYLAHPIQYITSDEIEAK